MPAKQLCTSDQVDLISYFLTLLLKSARANITRAKGVFISFQAITHNELALSTFLVAEPT